MENNLKSEDGGAIVMRYGIGWVDPDAVKGVINDEEPSAFLQWDKSQGEGENSWEGYVQIVVELTDSYVERLIEERKSWGPDVPKPAKTAFTIGPLSWRDVNETRRALADARDGAWGKPE